MNWKNYVSLAGKNLKGRKVKTILQVSLLVLALLVILVTNMVTYGLNYFLTTQLNQFYAGREMLIDSPQENKLAEIKELLQGDKRVVGMGRKLHTGTETADIREGESLWFDMHNYDVTYQSYLMGGCREPEKGEVIIPKYIFGPEVYEDMGIREYIDGEQWIGKDLTFQHPISVCLGVNPDTEEPMYKNWDEEKTFRVVGVFDNIEFGEVDCMGLVSEEDAIYLDEMEHQDYDKYPLYTKSYSYHVLVKKSKDVQGVAKTLEEAGIGYMPRYFMGEESFYLPYVRFARLIGNLVGILILLWAFLNIILYYRKDMLRRIGELGLMKAIGYTTEDISSVFLAESVITGIISIVISLVFGGLVALVGNYGVQHYLNQIWGKMHFLIMPQHLLLIIVLVAVIVLFNHILTLRRIKKLQPDEAIKGE